MIDAYFKFQQLPDSIKQVHNIRSKTRLDCIASEGDYQALKPFTNLQGQLFVYLTPAREFVKANSKRIADYALTNHSINISSIYIEDLDYRQYGYGYPNGRDRLKNGAENPLFSYCLDGFLFIVNKDYTQVELFIIKESKHLISSYYQSLIDGLLDISIERARKESRPFFDYGL